MVATRELIQIESLQAAQAAGLRYVSDSSRGIRRVKHGRGFVYEDQAGRRIKDARTLERIRAIVIPPAWTDVWISADEHGHIQATGRDARGRKQYRYHPRWREHRDEAKYSQLEVFGDALKAIRERVAKDLARPGLPREKVLAGLVRLLEGTMIRVGNDEYARSNQSYGLTTLLDDHVKVGAGTVFFNFRGKSGVERKVTLKDRQLAKVISHCRDIPGQLLFQYLDSDGTSRRVDSGDVNEYLHEVSGHDFTAKFFRTWGGTLSVMCQLLELRAPLSEREAKAKIAAAIKSSAHQLGNTATVCRKYYVHPAVLEAYESGALARFSKTANRARSRELTPRERLLMSLLKQSRSAQGSRPAASRRAA